jgi:hypothetical protein
MQRGPVRQPKEAHVFEETLEKPWHTRLFGPIEDVADAEYITSGLGVALVAVGVLGLVAAVKYGIPAALGGLLYLALGLLIWRMKSSAAALVLLSLEILDLLVRFALLFRRGSFALVWVVWGFVLLWVSIRAVQATRAYHRLTHSELVAEADPKNKGALTS